MHGRPQLKKKMKKTQHTYGRNMVKDGDSTHDGSGEAVSEQYQRRTSSRLVVDAASRRSRRRLYVERRQRRATAGDDWCDPASITAAEPSSSTTAS